MLNRIRVLEGGAQTTVQDLGRFGWAHFGVSASGAADALALRAGNLLVGNAEGAAGLEMTLLGGAFEFENDAVIALAGSDFGAGLPLWTPVALKAGGAIRCGPTRSGARCYLCVARRPRGAAHDGQRLDAPGDRRGWARVVPGRPATHRRCRGAATAPRGRATALPSRCGVARHARAAGGMVRRGTLPRHVDGERRIQPHGIAAAWRANSQPGRPHADGGRGAGRGAGAAGGQPIILFVDHQTTGGYPKPANVISADFWRLGQLRPRDQVAFESVTIEQALAALRAAEEWLYSL